MSNDTFFCKLNKSLFKPCSFLWICTLFFSKIEKDIYKKLKLDHLLVIKIEFLSF